MIPIRICYEEASTQDARMEPSGSEAVLLIPNPAMYNILLHQSGKSKCTRHVT